MLSLLLLLASPDTLAGAMQAYRDKTSAEPRCRNALADEVVVCGRRRADRYRVPFVVHDAGDPHHEAVAAERDRLLARTSNCREKSLFLTGCGMAGVGVSSLHGVALYGAGTERRPLAP